MGFVFTAGYYNLFTTKVHFIRRFRSKLDKKTDKSFSSSSKVAEWLLRE
jgi:hypothetical protein